MNNTICFIPVRKGSKGIPCKNTRLLGGKPLVCWILDTVLSSGIADTVWIATDCDATEALIMKRYGHAVKVFRRSERTAMDDSPTIDVVHEFIQATSFDDDDRFILLQATSPFTRQSELLVLHREMQKGEYDSYIACCRMKKFRWDENGNPLDYTFEKKPMRQAYNGMLIETGAFYATTIGQIKKTGQLISGMIKVMEIGKNGMIDIDEEEDWAMAEGYLRLFLEKEKQSELLMEIKEGKKEKKKSITDYKSQSWYKSMQSLSRQLVFYIHDNQQMEFLLPLINHLNRPVLLLCEPEVDVKVEVGRHVIAVRMCYWDEVNAYNDDLLRKSHPMLYRYHNSFEILFEGLQPEGIILSESCHHQEQTAIFLAHKKDIPVIIIEEDDNVEIITDKINRTACCHYLKNTRIPCLHIGCGRFLLKDWLNADIVRYRQGVYYLNAGKPYPFLDASFDYIYSEHLFEHLALEQGINMLRECFRILKPGGKMRMAMPNFHFLIDLYLHPDEEINRRYLQWSFQTFIANDSLAKIAQEELPVYVINNFFHAWGHQFIHAPEELTRMLQAIGFKDIQQYPTGKSDTPVFVEIERHQNAIPQWANELETFVIEAGK